MPPRPRRRVLRELGPTRFLSGLQLVQLSPLDDTPWWWGGARPDVEGIKVDVVRPTTWCTCRARSSAASSSAVARAPREPGLAENATAGYPSS